MNYYIRKSSWGATISIVKTETNVGFDTHPGTPRHSGPSQPF
ncbi:MAG: hypothetical protein ABI837_16845 [Acidobacteriota bacterium]